MMGAGDRGAGERTGLTHRGAEAEAEGEWETNPETGAPVLEGLYNAADPNQVGQRDRAVRRRMRQSDQDLRWLMEQPQGRRWVWWMLERCGVYRCTFNPATPNALTLAFSEGGRNVGLGLLHEVQRLAPEHTAMMIAERGKKS